MARYQRRGNGNGNGNGNGGNKPIESISFNSGGGIIEASIWENEVGEGNDARTVLSVTIQRAYNDGKEWKHTKSLRPQDIPHVMVALQQAYLYCQNEMAKK